MRTEEENRSANKKNRLLLFCPFILNINAYYLIVLLFDSFNKFIAKAKYYRSSH